METIRHTLRNIWVTANCGNLKGYFSGTWREGEKSHLVTFQQNIIARDIKSGLPFPCPNGASE